MSMPTSAEHEIVQEPSTTKNSSSSRAPKTGAQLRDNPEERNSQTGTESRTGDDLRIRVSLNVENKINTAKHPGTDSKRIRCRARHREEEHHAANLSLHNTSTWTNCQCTAPKRATTTVVAYTGPTMNLSKNWKCSTTSSSMS